MRFGIITEDHKSVHEYWNKSEEKFSSDPYVKQYVWREVKQKKADDLILWDISFGTLFNNGMYRMILLLVLITAISLKVIFGVSLIPFVIGGMFISLPLLIQQPFFVYFFIRRQMRKLGYKGHIQFLSVRSLEVIE